MNSETQERLARKALANLLLVHLTKWALILGGTHLLRKWLTSREAK